jgi:FKBP-type peptidyl-prolyl cis-trans isomerase (trigger factor)
MTNIDTELKTLEEEEARLAERKEQLLAQKKETEKKMNQLDKLIEKSGFDSPKELVEAIIERYGVKLSGRTAKKAARRTRTRMTAALRDQIKGELESGKSMNKISKETGISYVVIAKVRNGDYDHL